TRRLKLPRDKTMAIGQAVNMEVFRPVREILRKMSQPAEPKEELKFAPIHSENIPRLPAGDTPFQGGLQKSPLEGSTPPIGGGRDVSKKVGEEKPSSPPPVVNAVEPKLLPSALEEQKAKLPPMSEAKKYSVDPYREPIE
ncbi:MAG: hypothetical protein G01um101417_206, partial [Parcubacteria group bacterium Gr01-1014_17]